MRGRKRRSTCNIELPRGGCPQSQVRNEDGSWGPHCYYHTKLFAGMGFPVRPQSYRITKSGRFAPMQFEQEVA